MVESNSPAASDDASAIHRLTASLVSMSIAHPRRVKAAIAVLALVALVGFVRIEVDTDPENMLADDHPVRVLNAELSETFGSRQQLVFGLSDEQGAALGPAELSAMVQLGAATAEVSGVQDGGVVGLGSVDGAAELPPDQLVATVDTHPVLGGNVLTADGSMAAQFVTIEKKDDALAVRDAVEELVAADPALSGLDLEVAGMPLAQESFGREMFIQMGLFAPAAGALVTALLWLFFRRWRLVGPAMALAMVSVIWTMGALIGSGNTLHIMSSMIPIFLMPVAILDAVHVLSEYHDADPASGSRAERLLGIYSELARPLVFTTITTAVGFASLALVPIPPVRVFGVFIALGVVAAWLLTLTLLPALVATGPEAEAEVADEGRFAGLVAALPQTAVRHRGVTLAVFGLLAAAAVPLAASLTVNDNPVRWFRSGSEIRIATENLNAALPGTYPADLVLRAVEPELLTAPETLDALARLRAAWADHGMVGASVAYPDLIGPTGGVEELSQARASSPLAASLIDETGTVADVRLQLSEGDNATMQSVVDLTDSQLGEVGFPPGVTATWGGETYLNLAWQDEMVDGMLVGFLSTLAIVVVLLVILFRSLRWALLAISPVAWTVVVVYAAMAVLGRDLDMPVVVLSTLVIGIGVDFAIHFVERFRELSGDHSRSEALTVFAGEPSRALTRNALVIAVGFLPLLFAALVPYVVVGAFLAAIIVLSWLSTMTALPALATWSREPAS